MAYAKVTRGTISFDTKKVINMITKLLTVNVTTEDSKNIMILLTQSFLKLLSHEN